MHAREWKIRRKRRRRKRQLIRRKFEEQIGEPDEAGELAGAIVEFSGAAGV